MFCTLQIACRVDLAKRGKVNPAMLEASKVTPKYKRQSWRTARRAALQNQNQEGRVVSSTVAGAGHLPRRRIVQEERSRGLLLRLRGSRSLLKRLTKGVYVSVLVCLCMVVLVHVEFVWMCSRYIACFFTSGIRVARALKGLEVVPSLWQERLHVHL